MVNRLVILVIYLLLLPIGLIGQDCLFSINGEILDKGSNSPLEYANLYVEEAGVGTITDSRGQFLIDGLCEGVYHIRVSHIGCETATFFIDLQSDTIVTFWLFHHAELLDEILIHASPMDNSSQPSSTISRQVIQQEGNKTLADLLGDLSGVAVLKNGAGISKPIIHGLYGNRITILNSGIAQAGQQWGNDHAPEIDPFVADHLSVLKGASALEYNSNAIGGVVLVETASVSDDPHLHGEVHYILQSNGRGHTVNATMEENADWSKWKLTGSYKRVGDTQSPNYFLTNTGRKELSLATQIEKNTGSWDHLLYYSLFDTDIGILRGAHVGNLTDLETAITKEVPFFTEDEFSYDISAPKQHVTHHLLKLESKYIHSNEKIFKFKYGGQLNNRDEFDVRRSGRSDLPALSLDQVSHFFEGVYNYSGDAGTLIKTGLQFTYTDNTNNPETGILPLIPDYLSHQAGGYFIHKKNNENLFWEIGGRLDYKYFNVVTISRDAGRTIERYDHHFTNYAFSGGIKYQFDEGVSLGLNAGHKLRSPEVNELYSYGLHQGVSGIEEGNPNLENEGASKVIVSGKYRVDDKFYLETNFYYQLINNYIYLYPEDNFRLTIRGAFPVFAYTQTNARISGMEFMGTFSPTQNLKFIGRYNRVRGWDREIEDDLIFIPPDNFSASIKVNLPDYGWLTNGKLEVSGSYYARQSRFPMDQDFLDPPSEYFLLEAGIGADVKINSSKLGISLRIENLLNHSYRDYLNRLRYFADEIGRNIVLSLSYSY